MPSSGLPIENLMVLPTDEENYKLCLRFAADARHALNLGLFTEWLESFVGAWNSTKDPVQASSAGIIEWDM
jgi:hypothetical protein